MNLWDLFFERVSTLVVTLGIIISNSSSPVPPEVAPEKPIEDIKVAEIREVFPDFEEAEEKIVFVRPENKPTTSIPKPEEPNEVLNPTMPIPVTSPEIIEEATSLVDLERKLKDLTEELGRTLAEKSPEPNLFTVADANNKARKALVNILCISKDKSVRSITGSGVLIDERGVILTNSHVAQLFLLRDYPEKNSTDCTIRVGSPAVARYRAKLLYMPPQWLMDNKTVLIESNPQGTGENDYAFLQIDESLIGPLPASFDHLVTAIADKEIESGKTTVVAGYAAGYLPGSSIQKELYPVSSISKISELFTFKDQSLDLFSVTGTIVAQKGSSGGAAVDEQGNLIGLIVTSTDAPIPTERDLRAITISHIDRSLKKNRGTSLSSLLDGDIKEKMLNFNNFEAPALRDTLIEVIESSK